MDINERFERIINELFNGNKRAFAKAVGISPTVVENVVGTRKGKPSYDVLVKVCVNANISAEWVITGEGDMLKTKHISDSFTPLIESHFPHKNTDSPADNQISSPYFKYFIEQMSQKDKEIGRLMERIEQLEREKNVSEESFQPTQRELSKSTMGL